MRWKIAALRAARRSIPASRPSCFADVQVGLIQRQRLDERRPAETARRPAPRPADRSQSLAAPPPAVGRGAEPATSAWPSAHQSAGPRSWRRRPPAMTTAHRDGTAGPVGRLIPLLDRGKECVHKSTWTMRRSVLSIGIRRTSRAPRLPGDFAGGSDSPGGGGRLRILSNQLAS